MDCRASSGGELQSTINVTPLVDVVLVLLIILMVVVPLALEGYDLAIPKESVEPAPQAASPPVVLEIEPAGMRLDGTALALAELPARAAEIFAREPADRVLLLAVHDAVNYEAALRVVDSAQTAVPGLRIGVIDAARAYSSQEM